MKAQTVTHKIVVRRCAWAIVVRQDYILSILFKTLPATLDVHSELKKKNYNVRWFTSATEKNSLSFKPVQHTELWLREKTLSRKCSIMAVCLFSISFALWHSYYYEDYVRFTFLTSFVSVKLKKSLRMRSCLCGNDLQWNPVNTDTKRTCQNVLIIGVSVLSGFPDEKSRTHVLSMTCFTVTKRFNCTVTSFFCGCSCKA